MSRDYFTNRQDRYILFKQSPLMADYYQDLFNSIGSFSFSLKSSNELPTLVPPELNSCDFKHCFSSALTTLTNSWLIKSRESHSSTVHDTTSTLVTPLLQLGSIGIRQEQEFISSLLMDSHLYPEWNITIASGYLNFPNDYIERILESKANYRILTASPRVILQLSFF